MSLADILNPRGHAFKKTMFEFLKHRYAKNEQIIDRLSSSLVTDGDVRSFLALMVDVYESAYLKSVEDHKKVLADHNIKVTVQSPAKEG